MGFKPILEKDRKEIVKLYRKGMGSYALGIRFGVTARSVQRALKRWGVEVRKAGRPENIDETKIF